MYVIVLSNQRQKEFIKRYKFRLKTFRSLSFIAKGQQGKKGQNLQNSNGW